MRLLTLAVAATLAADCGARSLDPEAVRLDRVHCAACGMLISRVEHTAQAVSPDDDTRFYDDIGCLAEDAAHGAHARLYARSADGARWLPVEEAWFAAPAGLETPMGYGFAAFADAAGARGADRQGRALRWVDVASKEEARQ